MVEDRGPQLTAVAITFLALTWISTLLRCFVRTNLVKQFGSDDYLAIASLITFTIFEAFVIWGVHYGTGQHLVNLPLKNIPKALKAWFLAEFFYVISTTLTKFVIGVFLLRLSVKPSHRWIIRSVLSIITIYAITYTGFIFGQCKPVSFFWLRFAGATDGHCFGNSMVVIPTYLHTALNACADWTLGILPIFIIKDLNINQRTKATVALILALGAIGSVASLVRIKYISTLDQTDFLFATTDLAIWSAVEAGMGITASSLATLRPLFKHFFSHTPSPKPSTASSSLPSGLSSGLSYLWFGKRKTSTIYTAETNIELEDRRDSLEVELCGNSRNQGDERDWRDETRNIVQTQKHAEEEEAQLRKESVRKESVRKVKIISWDK